MHATLYFKIDHFKTAIPVSITALLVIYTLNNSISLKLPQTSDIKFIYIWIIFGLLLHFVIIILLILIERLPDKTYIVFVGEKQDKHRKPKLSLQEIIQIFAQQVLPIFETVFISFYAITDCFIHSFDLN